MTSGCLYPTESCSCGCQQPWARNELQEAAAVAYGTVCSLHLPALLCSNRCQSCSGDPSAAQSCLADSEQQTGSLHIAVWAVLTPQGDNGITEFCPESSLKALNQTKPVTSHTKINTQQGYRVNTPSTSQIRVVATQGHTVTNTT